jgi:hypothetical protein
VTVQYYRENPLKLSIDEMKEAVNLAEKILNRPSGDPDDDLAVLSRQFLRALERLGEYRLPSGIAR